MDSTTTGITANATSAVSAGALTTATSSAAQTGASAAPAKRQNSVTTATTAPKQDAEPQRDPRSLQFQVDGNRVVTTIVDENNKTVVVQIPDADVIRIAKAIDRMQGFLVQEKA